MADQLTPASFAILLALSQAARHGYALVSDVAELSGSSIAVGPGTLYRTLQRLQVDGLIAETPVPLSDIREDGRAERRRHYRITPAGRQQARTEARRLATLLGSEAAQALLAKPIPRTGRGQH